MKSLLHSKTEGYLKRVVVLWIKMADRCKVSLFRATCRKHKGKIIYLVTPNVFAVTKHSNVKVMDNHIRKSFRKRLKARKCSFWVLPSSLHVFAEKPPWNWSLNSDTLTDWGNSSNTH